MTDHDEILRLRTRVGDLERRLLRLQIRGGDHGRELELLGKEVAKLVGLVDGMTHADELAAAVKQAIQTGNRRRYTIAQKAAAGVVAVIVAVPAASQVVAWFN